MSLRWIPNAICVARILLIIPMVLALLHGQYVAALALIVVAGASDLLDGFLAKTFDWRTRLGGLLDPAADKLLVLCAYLTLTWLGFVPLGLTAVVILRDVVIVAGALAYQVVIGKLRGEPTLISKLNTACQLAFLVFTIMRAEFIWPPPLFLEMLGAAVVFTSITSGLNYVLVWARRTREQRRAA